MSILQLKNISQAKNGTTILQGITTSFPEGKVSVVIGRSGCGKSSLLRLLNGLDSPTDGEILYNGRNLRDIPPTQLRREVGMILQVPVMFEGTVQDNIGYGPGLRGQATEGGSAPGKALEKRCHELLDFVGLPGAFCTKDAGGLSVGEKQRVAFARALANEPSVLLMDEPTSALDRESMAQVEELIGRLRNGGMTIVMVSHNLTQARRLAEFVAVMEEGQIKGQGPPAEVFADLTDEKFFGECCHD